MDKIPMEARWQIATKGLTGAFTACASALKDAVGEEKYNEFNGGLWHMAGKGAKDFADAFGLKAESPMDVAEIMGLLATAAMGPESGYEVFDATEDQCAIRHNACPWYERWKEQGLEYDYCKVGHQRWADGICESVNPDFSFRLTKSMIHGDSCCEGVVERKG
jgi:hypothetical protein